MPNFFMQPVYKTLSNSLISASTGLALGVMLMTSSGAFADTQVKRGSSPAQAAAPKEHPAMSFPGKSKGPEAFKRLKASGKLPAWANFYDLTEASVQSIFEKDNTANLDENGRLFFVEPASTGSGNFSAAQTGIPADQTFFLNSSPNSTKTIYLDFTGHTTTGTAWNSTYNISTINSPAYDLDNVPGSFNSTELTNIQTIWKMVAEDYAAFDVNVTTQEPAADRLVRSSATDNVFGMRVVITRDFTTSTSNPCRCGGFAYVGVYGAASETYKPAFVFYNAVGGAKGVAEAASHEAGHTLGLSHDGTSTLGYYAGHGSGETGWAPIMGVGYDRNLVQWSKGEYANANQKQDDYAVMQSQGLVFDVDEHGNTPSTATILTGSMVNGLQQYRANGILQGPADTDHVSVVANAGSMTVDVKPLSTTMGNADLLVSLINSQGVLLAQSNSLETLGTSFTFNIPAQGTYVLKVEGTGKGDPLGTGYTRYGSIGYWNALITTQAVTGNTAPVARISSDKTSGTAPTTINFSASGSSDPEGSALTYAWDFGDGSTGSGVTTSKIYQAAGTYTAAVRVTDAGGLSSSASVNITVTAPVVQPSMRVSSITMVGATQKTLRFVNATVTMLDDNGNPVPGVSISGNWSGIVSGAFSGVTGTNGQFVFKSPTTKNRGTYTFTVNSASKSGFVYKPETSVTSRSLAY